MKAATKAWKLDRPTYAREWSRKNPDRNRKYRQDKCKRNPERYKQLCRNRGKRRRDSLAPYYLRKIIKQKNLNITPDQLKEQIQLSRTHNFFQFLGAVSQLNISITTNENPKL
jgi:hypothetical protein